MSECGHKLVGIGSATGVPKGTKKHTEMTWKEREVLEFQSPLRSKGGNNEKKKMLGRKGEEKKGRNCWGILPGNKRSRRQRGVRREHFKMHEMMTTFLRGKPYLGLGWKR